MDPRFDIHKASGILIKDRKLLIVRQKGKEYFIAPGGKLDADEKPTDALVRELKEELSLNIDKNSLELFGSFYAPSAGQEDLILRSDVFLVNEWHGELHLNPKDKVNEYKWVTSKYVGSIKIGSIFEHEVIPRLKSRGLID